MSLALDDLAICTDAVSLFKTEFIKRFEWELLMEIT